MIIFYSLTLLLLASTGPVENAPFFGDIIGTGLNIIGGINTCNFYIRRFHITIFEKIGVVNGALGALRGTVVAIGSTIEQVYCFKIDHFCHSMVLDWNSHSQSTRYY